MERRSGVSFNTVVKGARRLLPHPWIASKLISLQLAKWFFPLGSVRSASGKAGKIRQLSIRITDICNLRCHTCGQWGDNGFLHGRDMRKQRLSEVQAERYLELFEDLVDNGHRPNVYLWGGEPTMYTEMRKVIAGATALKLPTSIATNGHRLSEYVNAFVGEPLFLLQVSIDGHDRNSHNRARPSAGQGDAFRDIDEGLEAVYREKLKRKSALPLVASLTVVSRQNINHLVDIYHRFKHYVDVFVFYLSWWIDEEHAELHERDFLRRFGMKPKLHRGWLGSWKPEDYRTISAELKTLQALGKKNGPAVTIIPGLGSYGDLEKYYTDHQETFGFNRCISIFQSVELDSNGDMSPCRDYHDYVVGNVKQQTVSELWNSGKYQEFRRSLSGEGLMPVCSRCCGLMGY